MQSDNLEQEMNDMRTGNTENPTNKFAFYVCIGSADIRYRVGVQILFYFSRSNDCMWNFVGMHSCIFVVSVYRVDTAESLSFRRCKRIMNTFDICIVLERERIYLWTNMEWEDWRLDFVWLESQRILVSHMDEYENCNDMMPFGEGISKSAKTHSNIHTKNSNSKIN